MIHIDLIRYSIGYIQTSTDSPGRVIFCTDILLICCH